VLAIDHGAKAIGLFGEHEHDGPDEDGVDLVVQGMPPWRKSAPLLPMSPPA
jgi:hypothetical protein